MYLVTTENPTGHRSKGYTFDSESPARTAMGAVMRQLTELKLFGYRALMILDGTIVAEEEIRQSLTPMS